jgi:hypothetical protein
MSEEQRLAWSNQPVEKPFTIAALRSAVSRNFKLLKITSMIPRYGHTGIHRWVNSPHLTQVGIKLGFEQQLDAVRSYLGFGLHTILLARKDRG